MSYQNAENIYIASNPAPVGDNEFEKKKRSLSLLGGIVILLVVLIFAVNSNSSKSQTSFQGLEKFSMRGKKSSITRQDTLRLNIYKFTSSITTGTYETVANFTSSYLAPLSEITNLGCGDTIKIVLKLQYPGGRSEFGETHFVDSSRFSQVGKTVDEWSEIIEDMGYEIPNVFMHNKLQMYAPDLSVLYNKLQTDSVKAMYHLSKQPGSTEYDVAHITIPVPEAGTFYEIVSSAKNLTASQLENFSPWSDTECSSVHSISHTLDKYETLYYSKELGSLQSKWLKSTGIYPPMGIAIQIPAADLDSLQDTINAAVDITAADLQTTAISSTCTVVSLNLEYDDSFNAVVKYVQNTAAADGAVFTLSHLEGEIAASHDYFVAQADGGGYSSWDRYLDHHLGVSSNTNSTDPDYCSNTLSYFEAVLANYNIPFAPRYSDGTHFYSASQGLRSWEFNAFQCEGEDYTFDICGCLVSNNEKEYTAWTGESCDKSSIYKDNDDFFA
jgi:hypothetical protein